MCFEEKTWWLYAISWLITSTGFHSHAFSSSGRLTAQTSACFIRVPLWQAASMQLACVRCTVGGNQGCLQHLTNCHWWQHLGWVKESHELDNSNHRQVCVVGLICGTWRLCVSLVSALLGLNLLPAKQGHSRKAYRARTAPWTPPAKCSLSAKVELKPIGEHIIDLNIFRLAPDIFVKRCWLASCMCLAFISTTQLWLMTDVAILGQKDLLCGSKEFLSQISRLRGSKVFQNKPLNYII